MGNGLNFRLAIILLAMVGFLVFAELGIAQAPIVLGQSCALTGSGAELVTEAFA